MAENYITQFYSWSPGDTITDSRLNGNITNITTGLSGGAKAVNLGKLIINGTERIDVSGNATIVDLTATGDAVVGGDLDVTGYGAFGNIKIDTNTISSTDTNGDINFSPNGTGASIFSGNVGIAVTPKTWGSDYKAIQFGGAGAVVGRASDERTFLMNNIYHDGTNYRRIIDGYASMLLMDNGSVTVYTEDTGSADDILALTTNFIFDKDGGFTTPKGTVGVGASLTTSDWADGEQILTATMAGIGSSGIVFLQCGADTDRPAIKLQNNSANFYIWVDDTGDLRIKSGVPSSNADGTVVGTQS